MQLDLADKAKIPRKSERNPQTDRQKGQTCEGASWHLLDGLPSDLCHDGALSTQVFIAQTQEAVNDEG